MRKIITALLLVALAATTSFAEGTPTGKGTKEDAGKSIFPSNATAEKPAAGKLSNGVYFAWATLTGSYVIKTQHVSGLRAFGTASDSTAINWKPVVDKGEELVAPDVAANNEALLNETGWSVM